MTYTMIKTIIPLILLTITALPALAAPTNTSVSWGIDAGGFRNLSTALASPSTVGKTVVVSIPMPINNKTTDRHITITAGGKINVASGKTFNINGSFQAGLYQVFSGRGTVDGLTEVWPQWFGAAPGTGQSNATRTANVTAINKAFSTIVGAGTLWITDTFETNGPLLFGGTTQVQTKSAIKGNGDEKSAIIGFGTGVVVDAVGRRFTLFSGFRIYAASAECGLLFGRTRGGGIGDKGSDGSYNSLDHIKIQGFYTKAALITIASEVIRANDCQFWNFAAGDGSINAPGSYKTSPNNNIIAVTSSYGPLFASTNTDNKFVNCQFWSYAKGQNTLWLESSFTGAFTNCIIIAGDSDATNKHVRLIANKDNAFAGKLTFMSSHFEGGATVLNQGMTDIYCDFVGNFGQFLFIDVNINDTIFVTSYSPTKPTIMGFKNAIASTWVNWNTIGNSATSANIDNVFAIPNVSNSTLNLSAFIVDSYSQIINSNVIAGKMVWETGSVTIGSTVTDYSARTTTYGASPVVAGVVPTILAYQGVSASKLVIGPVYTLDTAPTRGQLTTIDTLPGVGFPGITPKHNTDTLGYFDGTSWRAIGAYAGTPASATAAGNVGTVLFDTSYIYVCTAPNTWRRAAIVSW